MLEIVWILRLDRYDIRMNLDLEDPRVIIDCGAQCGDRLAQFGLVVYKVRVGALARNHEQHTDECRTNPHGLPIVPYTPSAIHKTLPSFHADPKSVPYD